MRPALLVLGAMGCAPEVLDGTQGFRVGNAFAWSVTDGYGFAVASADRRCEPAPGPMDCAVVQRWLVDVGWVQGTDSIPTFGGSRVVGGGFRTLDPTQMDAEQHQIAAKLRTCENREWIEAPVLMDVVLEPLGDTAHLTTVDGNPELTLDLDVPLCALGDPNALRWFPWVF